MSISNFTSKSDATDESIKIGNKNYQKVTNSQEKVKFLIVYK